MKNDVCLYMQFTPRYLIQSTWLDETINAVVAGLNTAVYVRDLTPRPVRRRRRRTGESQQCFRFSLNECPLFGLFRNALLLWHRNSISVLWETLPPDYWVYLKSIYKLFCLSLPAFIPRQLSAFFLQWGGGPPKVPSPVVVVMLKKAKLQEPGLRGGNGELGGPNPEGDWWADFA